MAVGTLDGRMVASSSFRIPASSLKALDAVADTCVVLTAPTEWRAGG